MNGIPTIDRRQLTVDNSSWAIRRQQIDRLSFVRQPICHQSIVRQSILHLAIERRQFAANKLRIVRESKILLSYNSKY